MFINKDNAIILVFHNKCGICIFMFLNSLFLGQSYFKIYLIKHIEMTLYLDLANIFYAPSSLKKCGIKCIKLIIVWNIFNREGQISRTIHNSWKYKLCITSHEHSKKVFCLLNPDPGLGVDGQTTSGHFMKEYQYSYHFNIMISYQYSYHFNIMISYQYLYHFNIMISYQYSYH